MQYAHELTGYRKDSQRSLKSVADRIWQQSVTYRVYAAFVKVTNAVLLFTAKIATFLGIMPVIMFFSQKSKQMTIVAGIAMSAMSLTSLYA